MQIWMKDYVLSGKRQPGRTYFFTRLLTSASISKEEKMRNVILSKAAFVKKEEKEGMKGFFRTVRTKAVPAACGALSGVMLMSTPVLAASTSSITQPLDNLKTLVIAVIGAVGVIILAKNVMEFAQAYQQQDSSSMNSALKGIVAGIMMAGISTVLSFLGF